MTEGKWVARKIPGYSIPVYVVGPRGSVGVADVIEASVLYEGPAKNYTAVEVCGKNAKEIAERIVRAVNSMEEDE